MKDKSQLKKELKQFVERLFIAGTANGSSKVYVEYMKKGLTLEDIMSVFKEVMDSRGIDEKETFDAFRKYLKNNEHNIKNN